MGCAEACWITSRPASEVISLAVTMPVKPLSLVVTCLVLLLYPGRGLLLLGDFLEVTHLQDWDGEQQPVTGYLERLRHRTGHREVLEDLLGGLCLPSPALSRNENEVVVELRAHHAVGVVGNGVAREGADRSTLLLCAAACPDSNTYWAKRQNPACGKPRLDCATSENSSARIA